MLSVDEALRIICAAAKPLGAESVRIDEAEGRVLAADIIAPMSQPPHAASAMDGYAVRLADVGTPGARLKVVGEARAGGAPLRALKAGEAMRIFTGGVAPPGADHVVIQEDADRDADAVTIREAQRAPSNIRRAGVDFEKGSILKTAGARLAAIDLALIAAANVPSIDVARRPVIAYFDNGDELVEPGEELAPGQIVGSNRFAFDGLVRWWGGEPSYLGRADDTPLAVRAMFDRAEAADVLVPIGGASVGDHDYVHSAFASAGGAFTFEKVAVRPGKPTWFGAIGGTLVLGLPGNPASAIVCAALFLRPLIAVLCGAQPGGGRFSAALDRAAPANGPRESYLRAALRIDETGRLRVNPFDDQDSSLLLPLARAGALVRRLPHAPAAASGEVVACLAIAGGPIAR